MVTVDQIQWFSLDTLRDLKNVCGNGKWYVIMLTGFVKNMIG